MTKFDMGRAWDDAVGMLSKNKELVLVVAGVFFFLPQLLFAMVTADDMAAIEAASTKATSPEAIVDLLSSIYTNNWLIMLLLVLAAAIGSVGIVALLADKSRPTLGDALKTGLRYVPTYLGVQILAVLIAIAIFFIPIAFAGAIGSLGLAIIGLLIATSIVIYLMIRLGLSVPIMAIEEVANPVKVLQRSWLLTKGNGMRLLGFSILLLVAWFVVAMVISLIFGLVFGLLGEQVSLIGNGIVASVTQAALSTLIVAVVVAAYSQLSGGNTASLEETFE